MEINREMDSINIKSHGRGYYMDGGCDDVQMIQRERGAKKDRQFIWKRGLRNCQRVGLLNL